MAQRDSGRPLAARRHRTGQVFTAASRQIPARSGLTPEVVVLEDAVQDIRRSRNFYNGLQTGLGHRFVESILLDLSRLDIVHGVHACHFGFHRMLAARFPFAIYYRDTPASVEVFAVLDLRRNPRTLEALLDKRHR